MLKVRVIPTILTDGVSMLKGTGFNSWRSVGTITQAVRVYNSRDVDELVILDVSARSEERLCDLDAVEIAAEECRAPLTVGGGVNTTDDIRTLLQTGADKVVINTACYHDPGIVDASSRLFGTQCIVASIDAVRSPGTEYACMSHSGKVATQRAPAEWAAELASRGAGEILINRVENDGTLGGYDLELIRLVADAVTVPVIAAGGASTYDDLAKAVLGAGASAVAAGAMFQFTEQTPRGARDELASRGIPTRKSSA